MRIRIKNKSYWNDLVEKTGSIRKLSRVLEIPYSSLQNYIRMSYSMSMDLFKKCNSIKNCFEFEEVSKKLSVEANSDLAEFIGIYLGDGTLHNNGITISGDKRYDIRYFTYINILIKKVFGLTGLITSSDTKNTLYLKLCSRKVSRFFVQDLGFQLGDKIKNKSTIPLFILENRDLLISCLRGLFDSDGSYSRRGVNGNQFCFQFTSHNKTLLKDVHYSLNQLGFQFTLKRTYIESNSFTTINSIMKLIGSSNLRHIVRYDVRKSCGFSLYVKDVLLYYQKPLYKNLKLPYYGRIV